MLGGAWWPLEPRVLTGSRPYVVWWGRVQPMEPGRGGEGELRPRLEPHQLVGHDTETDGPKGPIDRPEPRLRVTCNHRCICPGPLRSAALTPALPETSVRDGQESGDCGPERSSRTTAGRRATPPQVRSPSLRPESGAPRAGAHAPSRAPSEMLSRVKAGPRPDPSPPLLKLRRELVPADHLSLS